MTLTPEQNRAICEWAGIKPKYLENEACFGTSCVECRARFYPDLNTDRLAVCDLLDVLVSKDLTENSLHSRMQEDDKITLYCFQQHETETDSGWQPTKEAAILAAVLQVMEKEPKLL